MVKYYGRAKQRTGSVNTNQIGLNMSGCVSRVGRTGTLAKSVSMRSKCNVKFCGDVYYQGQLWATNEGACVEKAPRTQSFNSGVGHSAFPAFKCGAKCSVEEFRKCTIQYKLDYLRDYFEKTHPTYTLCLLGKSETIQKDLSGVSCEGVYIKNAFIHTPSLETIAKNDNTVLNYLNTVNKSAAKLVYLKVYDGEKNGGEIHEVGLFLTSTKSCLANNNYGEYQSLDDCAEIYSLNMNVPNTSIQWPWPFQRGVYIKNDTPLPNQQWVNDFGWFLQYSEIGLWSWRNVTDPTPWFVGYDPTGNVNKLNNVVWTDPNKRSTLGASVKDFNDKVLFTNITKPTVAGSTTPAFALSYKDGTRTGTRAGT
tara:strand:- start:19998 stop:21092 length:1095 start_codon:yes stop_codon:yes gene_type:complete